MTSKIISTYIAGGYTLAAAVNYVSITSTGGVGGTGIYSSHYAKIVNSGHVDGTTLVGINLSAGGVVDNMRSGTVYGVEVGIAFGGAGVLTNYGVIQSKTLNVVALYDGGAIFNGAYNDTSALIAAGGVGDIQCEEATTTVKNFGTIAATLLMAATNGYVKNGGVSDTTALISGADGGMEFSAANGETVENFGTVLGNGAAGIEIAPGSLSNTPVVNGAATDMAAKITGAGGVLLRAAIPVINFGTIGGLAARQAGIGILGGYGVELQAGGSLTSGSAIDHRALIYGYTGVLLQGAVGTVSNFGAIEGLGSTSGEAGVLLVAGGLVDNGTPTSAGASISGYRGVAIGGGDGFVGAVNNYGTITGYGGAGVVLTYGGRVTNGAINERTARIAGAGGIELAATGTVANFGTVEGETEDGVYLQGGGLVTNGGGADRSAEIDGANGFTSTHAAATLQNFGAIQGAYSGAALLAGGRVNNGSLNNATALIEGDNGVKLYGAATLTNFGIIRGDANYGGFGVFLYGGQGVTNGAAGHSGALIQGFTGVYAYAAAPTTVTNFGTIAGLGGTAVELDIATDTLVVEGGCAFIGAVLGGGGTLDLASGDGVISNFGTAALTVSGSMAVTTFQAFGAMMVNNGATFVGAGAVTLAAGQSVIDMGVLSLGGAGTASIVSAGLIEAAGTASLTLAGAVTNTGTIAVNGGTLTVAGAVSGKGVATINSGLLDVISGFSETVTFTGTTGELELGQSQGYAGSISGFSKTGSTSLDLADIGFVSAAEATFSGTSKSGVLTVSDGTHTAHITLMGNYTKATFVASSDGRGGTTVVDPPARIASGQTGSSQAFIAAMASVGNAVAGMSAPAGEAWSVHGLMLGNPRVAAA